MPAEIEGAGGRQRGERTCERERERERARVRVTYEAPKQHTTNLFSFPLSPFPAPLPSTPSPPPTRTSHTLTYYESFEDMANPKGSIDVSSITSARACLDDEGMYAAITHFFSSFFSFPFLFFLFLFPVFLLLLLLFWLKPGWAE